MFKISIMNGEVPKMFFTTKLLIHPNYYLTLKKKHFLYDELDENKVRNMYLQRYKKEYTNIKERIQWINQNFT